MPGLELTDEQKAIIQAQVEDAEDFTKNELSAQREKTWRYYNGQIDLKAPRDRSNVVRPEVRNAVEMMMPQLMGVFASAPIAVEFFSKRDPVLAEEATERVNNIFWEENPGWVILHDSVKDSLVTRTAGYKIHLKEKDYLNGDDFLNGQDEEAENEEGEGEDESLFGTTTPQPSATQISPNSKFEIEVIPSEEILIDRYAKDAETATLIGQKSRPRLGDLVEMGFDPEDLKKYGYSYDETINEGERARTGYTQDEETQAVQWQLRKVEFTETFHRMDINDDGVLERVQVCRIDDDILYAEEVQEQPYVLFSSIRIPHTAVGRCPGELLMDHQNFESVLMRQTLDNLFWSNNPAIGVLRNAVNPFQVDNWGFGSVIDQRVPNAVQIYQIPFFADKIIPMFQFFAEQRESLIGINKASAGLDVNAFRNQTAAAAMGMMNAAQRQIEMLARVIAQTGLVPLFKKLFKIIYGRPWPYGMKINVGLGNGTMFERLNILGQIKQAQEGVLTTLGGNNPICSMSQYAYTLTEMAKLAPYYPEQAFFNSPAQVEAKVQELQKNPPQSPPDPKMIEAQAKAQATQQKAQLDAQTAQAKLATDQQKAQADIQVSQQKAAADVQIEREKLGAKIQEGRQKIENEFVLGQQELVAESKLAQQELVVESQLEAMKIKQETKAGQGNIRRKKLKAPKS